MCPPSPRPRQAALGPAQMVRKRKTQPQMSPALCTLLLRELGPAPTPVSPSLTVTNHCTVDLETPKEGHSGP